jgi:hypothetical protein
MRLLLCALSVSLLFAANFKLYLKDGNFQIVREYKVDGDNLTYYSVERSDWEDIPLALVDLKRTEGEKSEKAAARAEEDKVLAEEDSALKAELAEIKKIPRDPGVYCFDANANVTVFPQAVSKIHTDKGRTVLKVLSPLPVVNGKAAVEIDGDQAPTVLHSSRPDIYIQLSAEQRFGIIKLAPHKGYRVAERITIVPVSKEVEEDIDEVAIFRKQLTESDLYKIWPEQPLEPGEYAVIQYIPGKLNAQMWDFSYRP